MRIYACICVGVECMRPVVTQAIVSHTQPTNSTTASHTSRASGSVTHQPRKRQQHTAVAQATVSHNSRASGSVTQHSRKRQCHTSVAQAEASHYSRASGSRTHPTLATLIFLLCYNASGGSAKPATRPRPPWSGESRCHGAKKPRRLLFSKSAPRPHRRGRCCSALLGACAV